MFVNNEKTLLSRRLELFYRLPISRRSALLSQVILNLDQAELVVLDIANHPSSAQVYQYLEQYADHFQLRPFLRLETTVTSIHRSDDKIPWTVSTRGPDLVSKDETFDKVIVTTGTFHSPVMPQISGIENFKGEVLHSQAFKK